LLRAAPAAAASSLRQAVLSAAGSGGARLVLELSAAPAGHKVFALSDPERVVIDLPQTSLARGLKLPLPAGPVRELRDGRNGSTLRLVLELKQGLPYQARVEGRQLIVELGQASAPVAAAPEPPKPVRAEHAPKTVDRAVVVAIDPGHGGKDPGAIGKAGTQEKHVVLAISRLLAKLIDAEPGMKAYLTRNDDRFIVLRDRIALARRARADIFISVHADSVPRSNVTGSSVYVLSEKGASSEAADWLAKQENAADLKGGVSLGDKDSTLRAVLMDVTQTRSIGLSATAADAVLGQLDQVGTVRKTQVQNAAFVVLKSPDIPSMLVETAFISNPGEEKKLRTATHQQAIAAAIFKGVREYFVQNPPDGTLFARQREERRLLATAGGTQ
jgi:N-acetylmuramoyl-L-alanine amidase